jgi:CRISPR/Cas system-associated exonuclease Cas4 (RecB family)
MPFVHDLVKIPQPERVSIDGKRYYQTPTGSRYPSVTTVLSTLTAEHIASWRKRVGAEEANRISTQASRRGTAVHGILESYVLNKPDYLAKCMPTNIASFKMVQKYLDEHCGVVRGIESTLWSDHLMTAGQCDLIAEMDGELCIVDYKTAKKAKPEEWIQHYFLQCTTYAMMLYERTGLAAKQFIVLIATDEDGLQVFKKPVRSYMRAVNKIFHEYHRDHSPPSNTRTTPNV